MRRPVLPVVLATPPLLLLALTPVGAPAVLAQQPTDVVVRVAEVHAAADPKTAVVAGPAGSELVGAIFRVRDSRGDVVLSGLLEALPRAADGSRVDPAPFGEVATADLGDLDRAGDYTVEAAGAAAATTVATAPYADLAAGLHDLFDHNADGKESRSHAPSHLHDKRARLAGGPRKGERVNMLGGYMDAGDQVKFTLTVAHATVLLELALAETTDRALRGELTRFADIGIRYLRKAHPRKDVFVSLVGDVPTDHGAGFRDPASDDDSAEPRLANRPASVFTRSTGGADAAGMVATALALASDRSAARQARSLVADARDWLRLGQKLKKPWRNDYYPTRTWRDDLAAAQVALGAATDDAALVAAGAADLEETIAPDGFVRGWEVQVDGYDMAAVPAAMLCGVTSLRADRLAGAAAAALGCEVLEAGVGDAAYKASFDPFALPAAYVWGTTRQVGSSVSVALWAQRAGVAGSATVAVRGTGWFLGANPWGVRFQAGDGWVEEPYHWMQVLTDDPAPVGAVVGGPAPVGDLTRDPFLPAYEPGPYDTAEVGYRDLPRDYVSNEVSIGYSAPWVLATALLQAR